MRVTTQQIHRTSMNAVTDARNRMQAAQETAVSGKRVRNASDDPASATRARLIGDLQAAAQSHQRNIQFGVSRLQAADDALSEASNQLIRAKEIALAMANETMTSRERTAARAEVSEIRDSLIDIINTQHLGEYLFANVDTRTPPFDSAADAFAYDVDVYSSVRRVEVGPSQLGEVGASAAHAFAQRAADPASLDVARVLADLEAALAANDPDAVRARIDPLDQAFAQVLAERSQAGVRMQRLREADEAADQSVSSYRTLQSELVDADAAEAFSELSLAQTTMQAAVSVAARILGPSLLDAL